MSSLGSSDEGEVRDGGSGGVKAHKSRPHYDGTGVDRQDRTRSRYESRSPIPRNRSRSPYRASRGEKRSRDEDQYDRGPSDSRRFKVHYEDRGPDLRRSRISYDDLDNGPANPHELRYDDRDSHYDKRHRTRSRSPYRADRDRSARPRDDHNTSRNGFRDMNSRIAHDQSVSNRGHDPLPTDSTKRDAKSAQGHPRQPENGRNDNSGMKGSNSLQEEPEVEHESELDEAAQIELRRKNREALRAKYRGSATPMLVQALHSTNVSAPPTPGQIDTPALRSASPADSAPNTPMEGMDLSSPSAFPVSNDEDLVNTHGVATGGGDEDGPSAADYDPTMDMREDRHRDRHHDEVSTASYDETKPSIEQDVLLPVEVAVEAAPPENVEDEFDMFASDDDDMFAEEPPKKSDGSGVKKIEKTAVAVPIPEARELGVGMLDNWDDPEGYYKIIPGELLNGRYHVQSNLGQGMFSGVVRATDVTTKRLVAIKLIRNNETMRKAGAKEIEILEKLMEADPEDKKHMIRLERSFEHKGHLCMVFENLSINLREVLKKFGRDVGINLKAVRAYSQQMFLGLSLMRKCNILHADLKPDNILVNEGRNLLKICDLGSASDASENEITPYLVSRFYRAPEIILGMPYDFAIDVWSIGCTLYEMYTGKILFTGRTNNQMLRSIMECRGPFTRKVLNQAQFAHMHFDVDMLFRSLEQDKITGRDTVKMLAFAKPARDLRTRLLSASKGLNEEEMKELNLFTDFLDRCLSLNPAKRMTPNEALKHPFLLRPVR